VLIFYSMLTSCCMEINAAEFHHLNVSVCFLQSQFSSGLTTKLAFFAVQRLKSFIVTKTFNLICLKKLGSRYLNFGFKSWILMVQSTYLLCEANNAASALWLSLIMLILHLEKPVHARATFLFCFFKW
jgi:hypothetical protein